MLLLFLLLPHLHTGGLSAPGGLLVGFPEEAAIDAESDLRWLRSPLQSLPSS